MLWCGMYKQLKAAMLAGLAGVCCLFFVLVPGALAADVSYAAGEMALGDKAAPVKVIEYASMTCPHCAHFAKDTFDDFKAKYIDTGKVYFIFREFPLDRLAFQASKVARCSGAERFWPMISVLFAQQAQWVPADDPIVALKKIGRLAGLSSEQVDACLEDKQLADLILANRLKGEKDDNVESTPSFVVNGKTHAGDMSLTEFDKLLAPYLTK